MKMPASKKVDYLCELLDAIQDTSQLELCSYYKVPEDGSYPFIPLRTKRFVAALSIAMELAQPNRLGRPNFLDVGCGDGTKVLIASAFGCNASGIEHDPECVKRARSLYRRTSIETVDALQYEHYGDFDIVYFYCPIRDTEKQILLEQRIASQVRPGTILIQFLKKNVDLRGAPREPDLEIVNNTLCIYRKKAV